MVRALRRSAAALSLISLVGIGTSQEQTHDGASHQDDTAFPPTPPEENDDEEAARRAAIEESRRKLAELERDRPLWESAAKQRAASEQAEEAARANARRREREQAERLAREQHAERQRAEEAARRKADEAERQRRAAEAAEAAVRDEARRMAAEQRARNMRGPWTAVRAIEHMRLLAEEFDAERYGPALSLVFGAVPWPVLAHPSRLAIEDIDWTAVEGFFRQAEALLRPQEYANLVERSHKRFHPDRWRSRGLLKAIPDEEERGAIECAVNTVAQALTPIWRAQRSRR
jgi:hypothetical protein